MWARVDAASSAQVVVRDTWYKASAPCRRCRLPWRDRAPTAWNARRRRAVPHEPAGSTVS